MTCRVVKASTVHILAYGLPMCGFSDKTPSEWPPDHAWVSIEHEHLASCEGCILASERSTDRTLRKVKAHLSKR